MSNARGSAISVLSVHDELLWRLMMMGWCRRISFRMRSTLDRHGLSIFPVASEGGNFISLREGMKRNGFQRLPTHLLRLPAKSLLRLLRERRIRSKEGGGYFPRGMPAPERR